VGLVRRVWVVWAWLSPVALLVAVVAVPSLRPGARVWLWCWGILALWFVLARTKTVTWRFVGLVGLAGAALAPLVGLACVALAGPLGLDASGQDAAVVLAPVEEVGKLLPLAALLVVARARVRRFAVVDFLLVGLASGLGFQAVEDSLRRVWWATRPAGEAAGLDAATGLAQYRPGLLPGWSDFAGEAIWPGHHVSTAVITLSIGMAWWVRPRLGRLSWLLPGVLLAVACMDHAMINAFAYHLRGAALGPHHVSPPGWLVSVWDAWGNGAAFRPLLVSGLLVAIILDVRRMRRVRFLLVPLSAGGWTHTVTDEAERFCHVLLARSAPQPGWRRAAVRVGVAVTRLGAWTVADLGQELGALAQATARAPRRRRAAPRRRRLMAMMTLLRERRELGQELGRDVERASAPPPSGLAVLLVVAVAGVACAVLVAVAVASGGDTGLFMAGLFNAISQWWDGLTGVQQLLAGAAGAALVTFGGAGALAGPGVATAEDLLGGGLGGGQSGLGGASAMARHVVASLTPAEAVAAATTLTFARAAPRASVGTDADLDRLLEVAAAPGFMARRAADLATTAALLGRPPLNSEHAGFTLRLDDAALASKYQDGVPFTTFGFPDFAAYAVATVRLDRIVGRPVDELRANAATGRTETPAGHTWHRVEDCRTMLLVPSDLHEAVAHDGGGGVAQARAVQAPGS
jgi:A nuclease of the HNH/ENDO VII superfamily with conserved WHH